MDDTDMLGFELDVLTPEQKQVMKIMKIGAIKALSGLIETMRPGELLSASDLQLCIDSIEEMGDEHGF